MCRIEIESSNFGSRRGRATYTFHMSSAHMQHVIKRRKSENAACGGGRGRAWVVRDCTCSATTMRMLHMIEHVEPLSGSSVCRGRCVSVNARPYLRARVHARSAYSHSVRGVAPL